MADALSELTVLPRCDDELVILHQDDAFLIVNKPTRLLSVPGRHPLNRDSVIVRLQERFASAAIVHRLDFDTSGLLIVPLNKAALSDISKQFQARTVKKTYTAVVDAIVQDDSGVIDLPIAPDEKNRPKYKVSYESGKKSVTEFVVLVRDEAEHCTRIALHPVTGRSHQLRLHMQAIGHSIWGCEFYADERVKNKANRLLLHATEVEFLHPITRESLHFRCDPDF